MKTFFPKTRLAQLAARPGGIARDDAVAAAEGNLESLRAESDSLLDQEMGAIAALLGAAEGGRFSDAQMEALLHHGDRIVTLAGTFGHGRLEAAGKGLCDVTAGMMAAGRRQTAPVAVHLQALQLLAPGGAEPPPEAVETVFRELERMAAHLGVVARTGEANAGSSTAP